MRPPTGPSVHRGVRRDRIAAGAARAAGTRAGRAACPRDRVARRRPRRARGCRARGGRGRSCPRRARRGGHRSRAGSRPASRPASPRLQPCTSSMRTSSRTATAGASASPIPALPSSSVMRTTDRLARPVEVLLSLAGHTQHERLDRRDRPAALMPQETRSRRGRPPPRGSRRRRRRARRRSSWSTSASTPAAPQLVERHPHGRERRPQVLGEREIVEADDREVVAAPRRPSSQAAWQRADGLAETAGRDRRQARVTPEQLARELRPSRFGEIAVVCDRRQLEPELGRVTAEAERAPLGRIVAARTGDEPDSPVAERVEVVERGHARPASSSIVTLRPLPGTATVEEHVRDAASRSRIRGAGGRGRAEATISPSIRPGADELRRDVRSGRAASSVLGQSSTATSRSSARLTAPRTIREYTGIVRFGISRPSAPVSARLSPRAAACGS